MREERDRRDSLVREALDLVALEARRYRTWRMQRDDLHQAGMVGLLVAADRYDSSRGVPFRAYAQHWVRKEMQRAIAEQEFTATVPATLTGQLIALRGLVDHHNGHLDVAAATLGLTPATVTALHRQLATTDVIGTVEDEGEYNYAIPDPGFADPEEEAITGSLLSLLSRALTTLEHDERDALVLRYGLDGTGGHSFREIGSRLGCSDHTARVLAARARRRLRAVIG